MRQAIQLFNTAIGRLLRGALGVALIGYGVFVLGGIPGAIVALVGLAPIALGSWGHCLLELLPERGVRTA
jgi:DUF2892 family protein